MRIEDGTGTGNKLKIDSHGRCQSLAVQFSHEAHHTSWHSNFFTIVGETILPDGNETECLILTNDGSDDMELYWTVISADANVAATYYLDSAYASGGTEVTAVNMNRSSSLSASVTAYEGGATGNLVSTTTNEKKIRSIHQAANSHEDFNFKGGIIIPKNASIIVKATGIATNTVSVSLSFSFHTAGERI